MDHMHQSKLAFTEKKVPPVIQTSEAKVPLAIEVIKAFEAKNN